MSIKIKNNYSIKLTMVDLKNRTIAIEAYTPSDEFIGEDKAEIINLPNILQPFFPSMEIEAIRNCVIPDSLQSLIDEHYAKEKEFEEMVEMEVQKRLNRQK